MSWNLTEFVENLEQVFRQHSNATIAQEQKAYMRNLFKFCGIKAPIRKDLQRPFLAKSGLPPKAALWVITKKLWKNPEREFQYVAQELVYKYRKQFEKEDIDLLEYMVLNKSWWDTVDFIGAKLIGAYFEKYPGQIKPYVDKWLASDNIWLQRCCLLYQLKYKENLDTKKLEYIIKHLLGSHEFFINKAIGWVLREYSKTNPNWVIQFVHHNTLERLSKKEALRLLS